MTIAIDANNAGKMMIPAIRRASSAELVYMLQDIRLDQFYHPGHDGINKLVYEARVTHEIKREMARRDRFHLSTNQRPHKSLIDAIKERSNIADILEKYTEVFVHGGKWTFRCPLHQDKTPSGSIRDQKAHCFSCGFHGDVIDVVEKFGKVNKSDAIKELCRFYGIQPDVMPVEEIDPSKAWMEKYQ